MPHGVLDLHPAFGSEDRERKPHFVGALAEQAGGVFGGSGVGFTEQVDMQGCQALVDGLRPVDITVLPGDVHFGHQLGSDIGGDRDAAVSTLGEKADLGDVFPGELAEILTTGRVVAELPGRPPQSRP